MLIGASAGVADERAFVTNQNASSLSILDLKAKAQIAEIAVPGRAAGVAVDGLRGRVYTISPDDATLREHDMEGNLCRELTLAGGPIALAVHEEFQRAFVTDWYEARVFVVDLKAFEVESELTTGAAPSGVDISPDGAFVATADRDSHQVSIFDAFSLNRVAETRVGLRPFGVTFSDAGLLYVTNVGSNSVSVIDPEFWQTFKDIPTGERPYALTFAGGYGFVTDQYSDQLTIFREEDYKVVKALDVGEYPEGIDHNADETEVYVANWFSNAVSVIDVAEMVVKEEIETGDGPRAFGRFVAKYQAGGCDEEV